MQLPLQSALLFMLVGFFLLSSCRRELSCEGCLPNSPPVADAGPDQFLSLPLDSGTLDGSASFDRDGHITEWEWTKIAGSDSLTIDKDTSDSAFLKNLHAGVYLFELSVTDNGGLSAKDTVQISVDSALVKHPPIACAGADQTIVLPANTAILDGSCSTDPDGSITTFSWSRISGASTITSASAVQTEVTGLTEGTCLFELTVTDNDGLSAKDTVQISIIPPVLSTECSGSNRPVINARLVPFATLSQPRAGMAVAKAGTKILFAGGRNTPGYPNSMGSSRVDIYDTETRQWSTAELSKARFGMATATAGSKVFFAGGERGNGSLDTLLATVDIYDASTNTWSVASLREPRSYIAAATVGSKVLFAGGGAMDLGIDKPTAKVDIYDLSANTWSTALLSEARSHIAAVTVGDKIYFAGGLVRNHDPSNRIDIYDNTTGTWSTSMIQLPGSALSAISQAGKIYWAAGCDVEIKDVLMGNSKSAQLFSPTGWIINDGQNAVVKDNKIIYFRNYPPTNKFDIYDITTGSWSVGVVPQNNVKLSSIIAVNNTVYIAGGYLIKGNTEATAQVFTLEF